MRIPGYCERCHKIKVEARGQICERCAELVIAFNCDTCRGLFMRKSIKQHYCSPACAKVGNAERSLQREEECARELMSATSISKERGGVPDPQTARLLDLITELHRRAQLAKVTADDIPATSETLGQYYLEVGRCSGFNEAAELVRKLVSE